MMRAYLDVGGDEFMPLDRVATDPSLYQAAIHRLSCEINDLSAAERGVARNTLRYLYSLQPQEKADPKRVFSAVRKFLAGGLFKAPPC